MHIQNDFKTIVFDALIALIGGIGTIGCFILTFQLPTTPIFLLASLGLSFIYFFYTFSKSKNRRVWILIGMIVYLGYVFINMQTLYNGLLYCLNTIFKVYAANSQYTFKLFQVSIPSAQMNTVVTQTLWVIFTPVFAFTIRSLRQRRYLSIPFMLTLPFIFSIVLFTLTPNWNCFLMVLTFWISLLGMQVASHYRNHYISDTITSLGTLFAVLGFALLLIITNMIPMQTYIRDGRMDDIRIHIQTQISDMIEGKNTQEIGTLDLRTAQNRYYFGLVELIVRSETPQSLYLHGYSANRYEDNTWYTPQRSEVDTKLYQENSPFAMNLVNEMLNNVPSNEKMKYYQHINQVSVSDVREHNEYLYTPYYVITDLSNKNNFAPYLDSYVVPSENYAASYTYDFLSIRPDIDYNMVERSAFQNAYYDSNKKSNLEVPAYLQALFQDIEITGIADAKTDQSKIARIQSYIKDFGTYTLSPGGMPEGKDFISYFLSENKQGYCVHYASAATMLLRYYGIPARYASGYLLSADQFIDNEARAKDENAHAWVEILDPVFGWVPLEVTPASNTIGNNEADTPIVNQPSNENPNTPNPNIEDPPKENIPNEVADKHTQDVTKWLILGLGFCLLLIIPLRRVFILHRRSNALHQENAGKAILYAGKYVYQLSNYGVKISGDILFILEEAKFSNHQMNKEQQDRVVNYAYQCASECVTTLSFTKKIKFYLLHCLK